MRYMHSIFVWMSSGQTVKHAHDLIPATGQVESLSQRLTDKTSLHHLMSHVRTEI